MEYSAEEPASIQSLFNSIAKSYDRMNFILSMGLYRLWNRRLINAARSESGNDLLDLCAGTGEIAYGFLNKNPQGHATLLDFSEEMIEIARQKGGDLTERCKYCVADAEKIPFQENSFETITLAYGLRNIKEPLLCAQEGFRVLRKGGVFAILELTRPRFFILRSLHYLFLKTFLPLLGRLLANNEAAYKYLCDSINHFISPEEVQKMLLNTGFSTVKVTPLFGGVATLFLAKK